MLRRTKELHVNGMPILSLPAIDFQTVKVEFTPAERQFYDALFRKSIDIFKGYIHAGKRVLVVDKDLLPPALTTADLLSCGFDCQRASGQ
jgi:hypothetical protein